MDKRFLKNFPAVLRWGLTAFLCFILASFIYKNYQRLTTQWGRYFTLETMKVNPARVKAKAVANIINQTMPVSFDEFARFAKTRDRKDIEQGTLRKFSKYYKTITRMVPHSIHAYEMYAFSIYHLYQNEKTAIRLYTNVLVVNPKSFWSPFNLGNIYFKNGEYETASFYFKKATQTDAPTILKEMLESRVYLQLISSDAIKSGDVSRGLEDAYRQCFILLTLSYYRLDDFVNMLEAGKEAVRQNLDKQGFFSYTIGLALYHLKNYADAFKFFQNCIEKNPDFTESFYYAGKTLEELGQKNLASSYYEKAKALNETHGSMLPNVENIGPRIF